MSSFVDELIACQPLPQALMQTVRLLGEYKGMQDLFRQRAPQVLETLRDAAVIQSWAGMKTGIRSFRGGSTSSG